jgi:hypothetical protein
MICWSALRRSSAIGPVRKVEKRLLYTPSAHLSIANGQAADDRCHKNVGKSSPGGMLQHLIATESVPRNEPSGRV